MKRGFIHLKEKFNVNPIKLEENEKSLREIADYIKP